MGQLSLRGLLRAGILQAYSNCDPIANVQLVVKASATHVLLGLSPWMRKLVAAHGSAPAAWARGRLCAAYRLGYQGRGTRSRGTEMKFNVFGKVISLERSSTGQWLAWQGGSDGKRVKVELAVPDELAENELIEYLFDVFHEEASPWNGDITRIDKRNDLDPPCTF
jgi:hypothetical protein